MNTLRWKRRIGQSFRFLPLRRNRDVILLYHSVAGCQLAVPELEFIKQMTWLHKNTKVISLAEMLGSQNLGGVRVAISFDDGYEALYQVAYPIMARFNFSAIVYLNSGLLGETTNTISNPECGHYPDEKFLSWAQMKWLVEKGWSAGGHGIEHVDLTKTDESETKRQLAGCKAQIEAKLAQPCEHFAYTWGHFNNKVKRAVHKTGFYSAASGLHGPLRQTSDHFVLPRVDIRADYELRDFIDIVMGRWDYLGVKQRIAHYIR